MTYNVSYIPQIEGNHKVSVKYAGRDIPKSPYNVFVEGRPGDPSKVTAFGPGLNPEGNIVNKTVHFDISTKGITINIISTYLKKFHNLKL